MAFNADQFRKDAEAAGYSPEEIEAAIAKQSGRPSVGPAENAGMMSEVMGQLPAEAQTLHEDAKKYLGAGLGLSALGGAYGLYKAYQAHQDRALDRQVKQLQIMEMQQRLGLTPPAGSTPPAAPVAPTIAPAPVAPVDRLQQAKAVSESIAKSKAPQSPATPDQLAAFDAMFKQGTQGAATPATVPAPAPVAPPVANVAAEVPAEVAPIAEEAPHTAVALEEKQPGSKVAEAVVKDELVKPAVKVPTGAAEPPARTGSGMPAFPGGGAERGRMPRGAAFTSAADIPSSLAFVPGAQYYDSLANAARSRTVAQDIVRAKGSYPASDAQAREWAADYLKATNAPTREAMLAEGKKPDTVTGIFKSMGADKKKLAKMGGVAGALVALSDLANAQTPEEKMNAGLGVLGAIVPPGLDVLPAAAPGVPQARINESALLGSPYAQTDWAKYMRLREKAGAGRGFVNPR